MDDDREQLLQEFCRTVLDWRHSSIPRRDLERVATYLRETAIPVLEAWEAEQKQPRLGR